MKNPLVVIVTAAAAIILGLCAAVIALSVSKVSNSEAILTLLIGISAPTIVSIVALARTERVHKRVNGELDDKIETAFVKAVAKGIEVSEARKENDK